MARKRYTAEQIIVNLREAEVGLARGQTMAQVVRALRIGEQTNYRQYRANGRMRVDTSLE